MTLRDIYSEELSIFCRGHAVANPRRDRFQDRRGLRPPIDVGDIVYNLNGQLVRLFNCLTDPDQQDSDCIFPDGFEKLETAQSRNVSAAAESITVKETVTRLDPFLSKGLFKLRTDSVDRAQGAFFGHRMQGAVLVTSGLVKTREVTDRRVLEQYLVKNFDSWCSILESHELDVLPEDLMLITGVDLTGSWANCTWSACQLEGEINADVPSIAFMGGSDGVCGGIAGAHLLARDSGPNIEDWEDVQCERRMTEYEDVSRLNQVIFVRNIRGKKRGLCTGLHFAREFEAGDAYDEGGDSTIELGDLGHTSTRAGYMVAVLDFILENSDVDMAIAHADDCMAYHQTRGQLAPNSSWNAIERHQEGDVKIGSFKKSAMNGAATATTSPAGEVGISEVQGLVQVAELEDLEATISISRCAIEEGHLDQPAVSNILSCALQIRFNRIGKLEDLEHAISLGRRAVDLTPEGHSARASRLHSLGIALRSRYERLGELRDLDESVAMGEQVVQLTPDGHSDKPIWLDSLGLALVRRYQRLGESNDLEAAIATRHLAVELTPDGHPDTSSRLTNVGTALQMRFERFGGLGDIEAAITLIRRAIDLTPDIDPSLPIRLNNLGTALQRRFQQLNGLDDLEVAIIVGRRAVELTLDGHSDKPALLTNLGISLQSRFEHVGELEDLDAAISTVRHAMDLTPDGHPDKPTWVIALGISLQRRFECVGQLEDLDAVISTGRRVLDLTPEGHPDKPARLNSVGSALQCRFERVGELEDIEAAIAALSQVVELTPDGHPDKTTRLNNLSGALQIGFEHLGRAEDLDRAIAMGCRAVEPIPDAHSEESSRLTDLSAALHRRFESNGRPNDIEATLTAPRRAVELTPDNRTDKPAYVNNRNALQPRNDHFTKLDDPHELSSAHLAVEPPFDGQLTPEYGTQPRK